MPEWDVTFDRRVDLDDIDLIRSVAEAEAVAKFLRGVPLHPAVQQRLDRLNIIRAVRGTTGIEGADLTEDEVDRILAEPPERPVLPASRAREEQEARNAEAVMRFVAQVTGDARQRSLSEDTVRELHRLTTIGIDYPNNEPGVYRSHPVRAGDYVPPRDGERVRQLMTEFLDWLNAPPASNWPAVIRAVAAHFYFVSIHPFGDGNGRTARAIESYLLYQSGVNVLGFYSLANYYYRNRAEYIELLDHCRFNEARDLTPLIHFAVTGLVEELATVRQEVIEAVTRITFRDYYRDILQYGADINSAVMGRLLLFMDNLDNPIDEAALVSQRTPLSAIWAGLSARTRARDLARLESLGLIVREHGIIRPRYEAMEQFRR